LSYVGGPAVHLAPASVPLTITGNITPLKAHTARAHAAPADGRMATIA